MVPPLVRRFFILAFYMLMGIFNHDNCGIHHGADCNGNPAERHNIGIDALPLHHDKCHENRCRQREDCDKGASGVKKENKANDGDNNYFFNEFSL